MEKKWVQLGPKNKNIKTIINASCFKVLFFE